MGGTATSSSTLQPHRTAERQRDVTLGLRTLGDGHAYADPYVTIQRQFELDTYSAGDPAPAASLHRRCRLLFQGTREQITACLPAVKGEPGGQAVICPQRWLTRFAKRACSSTQPRWNQVCEKGMLVFSCCRAPSKELPCPCLA